MSLFNLDRHTIVEASAGTGKTYTLEQLVLSLLTGRGARLEQILLVTFTEKATGELKGRLRETLEKSLSGAAEHHAVLQQALDQFDQAPIYTIHGFCQRVLQEFALEQRHDLEPQLVRDLDLLEGCLREIQRKRWPEEYGDRLRDILESSGYDRSDGAAWDERMVALAAGFRRSCGHRLLPEPLENWPGLLAALEEKVQATLVGLRRLASPIHPERVGEHLWVQGFSNLSCAERTRNARRRDLLEPLLHWLADADASVRPLPVFQRLLRECPKGFTGLCRKLSAQAVAELPSACPGLTEAVAMVEELRTAEWPRLAAQLSLRTVLQLQEDLAVHKKQRGLFSFEDMLTRLDEGLDPAHNPRAAALVSALRQRYRYAIVDEFQDTDPLQWRIFKRIFVEGGSNRLFVVGDPKQAIFGFRGADLPTYLAAVKELKQDHGGAIHPLTTNWRSCPELLDSLNCLFQSGEWFPPAHGLTYYPVEAPPEGERRYRIVEDHTERAALTVVDVADADKLSEARRRLAHFVVHEIRRLLGGADGRSALQVMVNGPPRPLDAADIAVLVFKRREAKDLEELLRRTNIPYTFYKQPGLWRSSEALHVSCLLRALARPEKRSTFARALLTQFFRVRPEELARCDDVPPDHPARELFQRWLEYADKSQWGPLFQSLLQDTALVSHDFAESVEAERRLANYRHIFGTLEQAAYGRNLDLLGVLELLGSKRRQAAGDDGDLAPIESDRPKVRIMTVHSSKGLEFPVVFLVGGFTQGRPAHVHTYRDDQQHVVFDLCPDEMAKRRAGEQRLQEERRLLYVALTRGMFKLYVPRIGPRNDRSPGPAVTVLAPALEKSQVAALGPPRAAIVHTAAKVSRALESNEEWEETVISPSLRSRSRATTGPSSSISLPDELFPRLDSTLHQRRIVIRSFSSLHRQSLLRAAEEASYTERPPRADDDVPAALDPAEVLRGPVFGDLVHNILEKLDFAVVGQADSADDLLQPGTQVRSLIDEELGPNLAKFRTRVPREQFEEAGRQQIAALVWNTLRTPLSALGRPLCEVPPADRLHEVEFYFPERAPGPVPAEVQRVEGFLTGFMDLVLRREGRFFLVDWKTNWLAGYSAGEVVQSVIESDYVRQYRLYLQALARWLKQVHGEAFEFARDFGGVYYLYMRGMNGRDESSGVYFCRPTVDDLRLDVVLAD